MICSLGSPLSHGSPVAVFLNRGYPCIWNSNSNVPFDVVTLESYVNCLFDAASVVMRVTINKLYFLPEWLMSGVVDVLRNCGDQLYLFLTVILFLSCGNLSRPEEHTTMLNSPPSSNLLRS